MKKLFLFLILGIFLIINVNAATIDNVKSFDKDVGKYGKIEIKNWFGLMKLADLELLDNTDICGQSCNATKEITLYQDGVLIDDIYFETINKYGSRIKQNIRNYNFYIIKDGKKITYKLGQEVKAGTYIVLLEGEKRPTRTVDWVIKSNGEWLEEWALWEGIFIQGDDFEDASINATLWTNSSSTWRSSGDASGGASVTEVSDTDGYLRLYTTASTPTDQAGGDAIAIFNYNFTDNIDYDIVFNLSFTEAGDYIRQKKLIVYNGTISSVTIGSPGDGTQRTPQGTTIYSFTSNIKTEYKLRISGNSYILYNNSDSTVLANVNTTQNNRQILFWSSAYETSTGLTSGNVDMRLYNFTQTQNNIILNSPEDNYISSSNEIEFNSTATISNGATLVNMSLFTNETGSWDIRNTTIITGTTNTTTWTRTINDGYYIWNVQACDTDGDCGFAVSNKTFEIDSTSPTINIINPTGILGSSKSGESETLNWTVSDLNLDTCWYNYNGTNTTVTCGDNGTTFILENNVFNLTFYANDTAGNINSEFTSWSYNFFEDVITSESSVFETSNQDFQLNLSTGLTIVSITSVLNYNGTKYSSDSTCSGGNCFLENNIDIPLINTGSSAENKTFFWEIRIFNGTGNLNINTSSNIQEVLEINMSQCGTGDQAVNFTIYDENTLNPLNADFKGTFNYYLGSGTVSRSTSIDTNSNNVQLCINRDEDFITSYSIDLENESYSTRRYDFNKKIYNNVSTDEFLYLLNSSLSNDVIIEVKDEGLLFLTGVTVNISRYYSELGIFKRVASQITDDFGEFVESFILNDVKYKFEFYDSQNNLLKTSEDIKIICRATICVLPFVIESVTDEFDEFDDIDFFNSDLSFDNSTNMFTLSWEDQTSEDIIIRLEVTRYLLNSTTNVCNTTSTSKLSILSCSVGSQRATYKVQVFRTGDDGREVRVSLLTIKVGDPYASYGVEGLLWVFILLFTCIGIGSFNPTIGVSLYGVGFIVMGIMGVISMPLEVFFANTLLVIIFAWAIKT